MLEISRGRRYGHPCARDRQLYLFIRALYYSWKESNLLFLLDGCSLFRLGGDSLLCGGSLLYGLCLQYLLDNLLFLNEEGTNDTAAYTACTT